MPAVDVMSAPGLTEALPAPAPEVVPVVPVQLPETTTQEVTSTQEVGVLIPEPAVTTPGKKAMKIIRLHAEKRTANDLVFDYQRRCYYRKGKNNKRVI